MCIIVTQMKAEEKEMAYVCIGTLLTAVAVFSVIIVYFESHLQNRQGKLNCF